MKTKKVALGIFIFFALFVFIAVFLFYPDDLFSQSVMPQSKENLAESDYLTRSESDASTILKYPLITTLGLLPHSTKIGEGRTQGNAGVFLTRDGKDNLFSVSDETVAVLEGSDFHNGTIEVELKGLVSNRTSIINRFFSRGFVGICFRIDDAVSAYECLYLRPENGFSDDPIRRMHAVQYISVPNWGFAQLRDESPGRYENPAPIHADTWHKLRIEVLNAQARLFIDDSLEPVLQVDDLKLGANRHGKIGLWVGLGSDAFFRNLTITKTKEN